MFQNRKDEREEEANCVKTAGEVRRLTGTPKSRKQVKDAKRHFTEDVK